MIESSKDSKPLVGILMGSPSDLEAMKPAAETLKRMGIPFEWRVISAHRAPELLAQYVSTAQERGLKVFITGAGGAAHLPGITAAYTTMPVIGVPVIAGTLNGVDSFLSMVQTQAAAPVAVVPIGDAESAGQLAARILALHGLATA